MPAYEYNCGFCGNRDLKIRRVDDRNNPLQCEKCGDLMELAISVPATPVMNPSRPVRRPKNM